MKRIHLSFGLLLSGLILLSSCLKNDPDNNSTIFWGHQQIPNINEYMPERLLYAFGNDSLNFGDTPPKIEGSFMTLAMQIDSIVSTPDSLWWNTKWTGYRFPYMDEYPYYFNFSDQHMGIAQTNFKVARIYAQLPAASYIEQSSSEDTYATIKRNPEHLDTLTIAPSYFKQEKYDVSVFNHVYIMGTAPKFTAYYYEIRKNDPSTDVNYNYLPLTAVIISGTMGTETITENDTTYTRPVISNVKFGYEVMTYYDYSGDLPTELSMGLKANPGNVVLFSCDKLYVGQYEP